MIKNFNISPIVVFLIGALFIFIQQGINSVACQYGAFVALPALVIVPPAIFFRAWKMTIIILLLALAEGSFMPVRLGLPALLWLGAAALVHLLRGRYRNLSAGSVLWLMELVNLAIMLAYAVLFPKGELYWSDYFLRVISDIGISAVAIAMLGNLAVSVPRSAMYFLGVNLTVYEEE